MKNIIIVAFILFLSLGAKATKSKLIKLEQFETDYCTRFPEGTFFRPNVWKQCCFEHDLRYWFGGTKKQEKSADLFLKSCVSRNAGSFYGYLLYYGVRTGHYSPIKLKYKWGWGWKKQKKNYTPISNKQLIIVNESLDALELDPEYLKIFKLRYGL